MVAIGCLVRAHGIQGELLFLPWLKVEGALLPGLELTLDDTEGPGKKTLCLQEARRLLPPSATGGLAPSAGAGPRTTRSAKQVKRQDTWILRMEGCSDRNAAEALVGAQVRILRDRLPPLPSDEFLWEDLLGLQVIDEAGEFLGMIVEIFPTGGNEVLVMEEKGGEEILLPAIREVIREVDLKRGFLRVRMMEGLRGPVEGKGDDL
jgi:16S rRNA processing protein RimM